MRKRITLSFFLLCRILSIPDACVGAIYLANEEEGATTPELTGSVIACREMPVKSSLIPGEGLIGACYKDRQIRHVTAVSDAYIKVTSGPGESVPGNILIVPLNTHDTTIGVFEIASLMTMQPGPVKLMEKASEPIASNLGLNRINARNVRLVGSFREKEKELIARGEELHQPLEELRAIREQIDSYNNHAIHKN